MLIIGNRTSATLFRERPFTMMMISSEKAIRKVMEKILFRIIDYSLLKREIKYLH
jgi:hypothetical protein